MSARRQIISLYKQLIRESQKLSSYNFRMYAARKIRDSFQTNKTIEDFNAIDEQVQKAQKSLDLIRRQVIIGHLYTADKLVIEPRKTLRSSDD